jgi:hypothetical protein
MTRPTGNPRGRPSRPKAPASVISASVSAPPAGTVEAVEYARRMLREETSKASPHRLKMAGLQRDLDSAETALARADKLAQDPQRIALEQAKAELTRCAAPIPDLVFENVDLSKELSKRDATISQLKEDLASCTAWRRIQQEKIDAAVLAEQKKKDEDAAAAAALVEYEKWDAHRHEYATRIFQLDNSPDAEEQKRYEKLSGLTGLYAAIRRYGQKDCDGVKSYEREMARRESYTLFLNYATRIRDAYKTSVATGETVIEEVKQIEKKRKDDIRNKGLIAEYNEDFRRRQDTSVVGVERDPSFDPPGTNRGAIVQSQAVISDDDPLADIFRH